MRAAAELQATPSLKALSALLSAEGYHAWAHWLILLYCLFAPLSIAASQLSVSLLIFFWLACLAQKQFPVFYTRTQSGDRWRWRLVVPLVYWLLTGLIATIVGLDMWGSLIEYLQLVFYLLFPFAVASSLELSFRFSGESHTWQKIRTYLLTLLSIQVLAALHSVIDVGVSEHLSQFSFRPVGKLSESGQLVLVGVLSLGLWWSEETLQAWWTRWRDFLGFLLLGLLLLAAWPAEILGVRGALQFALQILLGVLMLSLYLPFVVQHIRDAFRPTAERMHCNHRLFLFLAGPVLVAALLVNLKRGPWLGVMLELILLSSLFSKRIVLFVISACALVYSVFAPVSQRATSWLEHFSIQGGRQEMWALGVEIIGRFPLGLGVKNSRMMQLFDPALPDAHKHMHNNLLNVAVETGLLGLLFFVWWVLVLLSLGFVIWKHFRNSHSELKRKSARLALVMGVALLGWQAAGFVEYNFGDGEVRLIAMLYMGILLYWVGQLGIGEEEKKSA